MNEKTANTRTPTVPGVLDDPIQNRGVAASSCPSIWNAVTRQRSQRQLLSLR
jgi:hypothetical protein